MRENIAYHLSNVIYTDDNMEKASIYLKSRGLDMSKFKYPWALTGKDPQVFEIFKGIFNPNHLTETLFIPVVDLFSDRPDKIIGFDCRYVGGGSQRLRFRKIKNKEEENLFYQVGEVFSAKGSSVIIVESAIDAETLSFLKVPILATLSTRGLTHKLGALLLTLYDTVLLCFDNDSSGSQAIKKFLSPLQEDSAIFSRYKVLNLPAKDANAALVDFGLSYLKDFFRFYF